MGPIRCPETSVNNYHTTPCNTPEDRRFHQHRGGSLKSMLVYCSFPQSLQVNVAVAPLNARGPFPSTSLPIHRSLSTAGRCTHCQSAVRTATCRAYRQAGRRRERLAKCSVTFEEKCQIKKLFSQISSGHLTVAVQGEHWHTCSASVQVARKSGWTHRPTD